jgi:polysaccharide export outer membrane protein
MNRHVKEINAILSGFVGLIILLGSCVSPKKVVYMNDLSDSTSGKLEQPKILFENPIQKNDQLQITVSGSNLADLPVFNGAQNIPQNSAMVTPGVIGYLVESDGKIELPYLGRIKAEGLSRLALQDTLAEKLRDYTKNPVVSIKFLNYVVSVLGEVARPGRINMPNERFTLLEAVAQAGDIGLFGKSGNVLVIREENGQRLFGRVNMLRSDFFKSPYFYLRNNDVVYVEPLSSRYISRNGVPQYIGIIAVGLSLILTTINLIQK